MIFMLVGEQYSIKFSDPFPEHLLSKIRAGIDYNAAFPGLYVDCTAQSLIMKIQ